MLVPAVLWPSESMDLAATVIARLVVLNNLMPLEHEYSNAAA